MSKLGMGVLNRVYLQFPNIFWDKNVDEINYISEKNLGWFEQKACAIPFLLEAGQASPRPLAEIFFD